MEGKCGERHDEGEGEDKGEDECEGEGEASSVTSQGRKSGDGR